VITIEAINNRVIRLVVFMAVLSASAVASAQVNIRVVTVKADRVAQWESLQKEATEAVQANGEGFRHIFQRIQGPLDTYLIITPEAQANIPVTENWFTAVDGTIVSRSSVRLQNFPDAATLQGGGPAVPTEFMHARLRTIAAGRSDDYYEWLRDELIPALREADVGDVRTLRVVLGGNTREWVTYSFVEALPGSGPNPLAESMGQQAMERMLARGDAMVTSYTEYFYRFRPDLSFDAP
jgi:hypothetical protein